MACSNITSGITLDCSDGTGGVDSIYIANGPVVSIAETDGVVTSIIVEGATVSLTPSDFFKFEVPKQTSTFTETINPSLENGTLFYTQEINMVFNKLSVDKRNQIALMSAASHMVVVFKDNNDKFFSVGLLKGAYVTAGTMTSGTAYGDRSGYEITITGLEKYPSYEVDAALIVA